MGGAVLFRVDPEQPDARLLEEAAQLVRRGGLVAFPTETVYGLAADGGNPDAVARLDRVKGRPPGKPYSIHLHDQAQLARFVGEPPPLAARLMARFWPGPLTIVLLVQGGATRGFRLPDHRVAREFLRRCPPGVVAPSANRSGDPPPTSAEAITPALCRDIDGVLDAGACPGGRESTVVRVVGGELSVLREGAISALRIHAALAEPMPNG